MSNPSTADNPDIASPGDAAETDVSPLPAEAQPRRGWRAALPMLVAAATMLALYAITLGGTFIYDDLFIALRDERLTNPQWWQYYWSDQYFPWAGDKLYRPLTSMTYALQAYTTGDNPFPFHLVNWLMAGAVAALVARMVQLLAGWWPALIAGLIFAVHPVHVEAIAGIVGRAELMCALGTVGGLVIYLAAPLTGWRIAAIVGCHVVALLSKEQGIFFPALLGMLVAMQYRARDRTAPPRDPIRRKRGIILAMLLVYVTAGYLFFREAILPMAWDRNLIEWQMNPMVVSTGADRWLMPVVLLGRYTLLLVWPRRLSLDYGAEVIGSTVRWHEPYFYIGAVVAVGAVVLLIRAIRRRDVPVAFALLSAGLLYGMVSNLPSLIGTIFAERLMFMPSIFLALLAGVWLTRLAACCSTSRKVVAVGLSVLLVLGAIRTFTYASLWNDRYTLYRVGLDEQPRSVQYHRLAVEVLHLRGEYQEAVRVAEHCVEVSPHHWRSYALLARTLLDAGDARRAEEVLQYAKDHYPNEGLIGEWMSMGEQLEKALGRTPAPTTEPAEEAPK